MTVHLIKLCVGVDSVEELADWQKGRLKELKKKKRPLVLMHVTRQTPKRAEELLDGGSLYWVIKGQIAVRDAATLEPLEPPIRPARVLAAAQIGNTRLIDNMAV